ncbi:MAG: hypothetical protein QOD69_2600 [Solirubrobacteraceae bacterium]|nr:hypothetical protein [Solirubrobacteraceae bacterium]
MVHERRRRRKEDPPVRPGRTPATRGCYTSPRDGAVSLDPGRPPHRCCGGGAPGVARAGDADGRPVPRSGDGAAGVAADGPLRRRDGPGSPRGRRAPPSPEPCAGAAPCTSRSPPCAHAARGEPRRDVAGGPSAAAPPSRALSRAAPGGGAKQPAGRCARAWPEQSVGSGDPVVPPPQRGTPPSRLVDVRGIARRPLPEAPGRSLRGAPGRTGHRRPSGDTHE